MANRDTIAADERRFLDERGSDTALAPNGLNPANILEKAMRGRIIESYFYQEQCFALNEADIIDRVVEHVNFIGGTYGDAQKPSPFICLAFKLLHLAPSDEILREYLEYGGENFKYLRALALFYARLTRRPKDVYLLLEPYLEDSRKLRRKGGSGTFLTHMDEFVDDLLMKDRVCGTSLFKIPKREVLEDLDLLDPRSTSDVEDMLDEEEENDDTASRNDRDESRLGSESGEEVDRKDVDMSRSPTPPSRDRSP